MLPTPRPQPDRRTAAAEQRIQATGPALVIASSSASTKPRRLMAIAVPVAQARRNRLPDDWFEIGELVHARAEARWRVL